MGDAPADASEIEAIWDRAMRARDAAPLALVLNVDEPHPCFEQLVRTLLSNDPRIHVLALVRYAALDAVASLMRAGTERFLTSETAEDALLHTLHDMCFRTSFAVRPNPVDVGLTLYGESFPGALGSAQLTAAEARVLRLLARGLRNREIAEMLYVSEPTVKRHTQRIYRKLRARDRAHAAAIAQHIGLVR